MYQMVWLILRLLHYLAKCILEEEITRRNKSCKPDAPCPHCGRHLESKGLIARKITTLLGVLDFYHAASHLNKAAHAYLHNDSHGAKLLFEAWRHLLRHGKHLLVLQSLTRLINVAELPHRLRFSRKCL